ncbi:O-antigen ligase family protein [Flavobacteriaceae bacterium]|nr:O-antigen ligase family protein [Flavobacteriaceae bacterium]
MKLSTRWGERIEAYFIGGVNNFSLFVGIAFIISFFQLKKGRAQIIYCLFFLLMIVLGMSRGALLGVILTLFITSLYDMSLAKFKLLMKYTFYSLFSGFIILLVSGKIEEVTDKIQNRFFSLFTGEKGVNDFFSARGDLFSNIFNRLSESSILQILFGHGNGGIDFYDYVSRQHFETSHNLIVDIFYRNGIILCFIYILIFVGISWMFIVNRTRNKVTLFGIFVFFHLELLVNPVLFAAQVGWVYALFMVYFLNQNSIKSTPINRIL